MKSLTGTLFKGVALGSALVLAAAGAVLFFSVRSYVIRQFDQSLLELAAILSVSVEEKAYGLEVDLEEMRAGEMAEAAVPGYLQVASVEGRVLYSSPALGGVPFEPDPEAGAAPVFRWEALPDGTRARSVLYSFVPEVDDEVEPEPEPGTENAVVVKDAGRGERVFLRLFKDSSETDRFLGIFLLMLITAGAGSLGVLSLIMWLVIRKGARPVGDLAARVGEIHGDDFTARIDEGSVLKELVPISEGFNQLAERIGELLSRERSFTSNAAHELRTPLAGLKTSVEVALSRGRSEEEYREVLKKALSIVNQMDNLVGGLLALMRLESGQESPGRYAIPLGGALGRALEGCRAEIAAKGVALSVDCGDGQTVTGDAALFSQVLDELMKNAVYYVNPNGSIRIGSEWAGDEVKLTLVNSGSQVSREDAERVFDRFWRGGGRSRDSGARFGLGLPLAKRILATMGGRLEVETGIGGDFIAVVTMPSGPRTR